MTIVMILTHRANDQSIHRHHPDRVITVASTIIIITIHRHHDITRNHLVDAVQAVAVIVVATHGIQIVQSIQIGPESIRDVNGHRADQAKAVVINVINIHMNEVTHEVIVAINKVVIEFCIDLWPKPIQIDFSKKTSQKECLHQV